MTPSQTEGTPTEAEQLRALLDEAKELLTFLRDAKVEEFQALMEFAKFLTLFREIKFMQTPLAEGLPIPTLAHPDEDVGYDLRTAIDFSVEPGQSVRVPTGLIFDLPISDAFVRGMLRIEQRTGNGGKGLFPAATVVDPGYRPDPEDVNGLTLLLRNVSDQTLTFKRGDAVMQAIFKPVFTPALRQVGPDEINWATKRGPKRFGDTGD